MAIRTEAEPAAETARSRIPQNAVTRRALLLGTILIPFNCYWIMMVEGIWHSGHHPRPPAGQCGPEALLACVRPHTG
jgi:hypothetical protein